MRSVADTENIQTTQAVAENYEKNSRYPNTGHLNEIPARMIFEQLHKQSFTGHLSISHREKRKKIWFFKGEVIRIQSNLVPELLGHLMIEKGWLSEEDLQTCLKLQRDALKRNETSNKRIGDFVQELYGIGMKEMDELFAHQKISSLIQAMTWEDGDFEFAELHIQNPKAPLIGYRDLVRSIHDLFDVSPSPLGPLFKIVKPWQPKSSAVDLNDTPLWAILAGCRMTGSNGILAIRKQNKLYEIVIKFGVPLTFYEGTFGQPRQTVVVRQASEEHEKFFIDQIFKLFSFLTGSAHFRLLSDSRMGSADRESFLQIREETNVTESISPEDIAFGRQPSLDTRKKMKLIDRLKIKLQNMLFTLADLSQ
ncbi:MAG: DUF4388 domain-containing protein [Deltaproteobacteria bacterium]|nr:DUF4388 domain-containing protein [Deltaproteobacteria bacterium]